MIISTEKAVSMFADAFGEVQGFKKFSKALPTLKALKVHGASCLNLEEVIAAIQKAKSAEQKEEETEAQQEQKAEQEKFKQSILKQLNQK